MAAPLLICFLININADENPHALSHSTSNAVLAQSRDKPSSAASLLVRPAYRIDLRSIVKEPFVFEPIGPGTQEPRSGIPIRSLGFLDNERLAVTVVTRRRGEPGLPKRGAPQAESPYRLDGILISSATGKIIGKPEWPTNSRYAGVVALNDRGFVIQTGNELELLSTDSRLINRMALSPLPTDEYAHDRSWAPRSSWSGRHLLLLGWRTWSMGPWVWVDAENLRILESWQGIGTGPVTASDDWLVMRANNGRLANSPPFLEIAVPGGHWEPIPSTANAYSAEFVGPNLLYFKRLSAVDVRQQSDGFLMRTDSGYRLRLEPNRKDWTLGQAAVSRAGNRFVILEGQTKGSHPALDISGHEVLRGLLVFERPFTVPSFTVEVRDSHIRNPDLVALSPDGRYLAILGYPQSTLEVFELQPPK